MSKPNEETADSPGADNPFKGKTGLTRLWNALGYSRAGLVAAYRNEDAFRQEVLMAAVMIPAAFFVTTSGIGRAMMIGSVLLVMIVELLNSAIEATVDRISVEHHHLAKRAKDIGSAAVLLALINLAAIWLLVIFGR
ncbi:MAG TPA: diacylglycerol kinase [Rhodocyclaceae bacterium]|nr:diacylglycerol kinase [Rhodocyclaceae bacterium]HMV52900.1 diacylglycerol kinase [Rhodocyclaceae bacterium]HMZ83171.1 diacylglycerol kinase [Rhodocyclaceae bacterium]HNA04710.1 diacylglycerol kinase [Rhodocyclaceae bacterium]HNB79629.1 diacylglycerol kinase [Rhodocyclaceae bacterium]